MTDKPDDTPNPIVAVAREAKEMSEAAAAKVGEKAKNWPIGAVGLGVGIGSAAVAAAVLFANRSRSKK